MTNRRHRLLVHLVWRGAGRANAREDGHHFNNFDNIVKQAATKLHIQLTLRIDTMIREVNPAFSPDQSVLNFC